MTKRLLIIGYGKPMAPDLKKKWLSEGLHPYCAESLGKAVKELDGGLDYSLVLILGGVNLMDAIRTVRRISKVPILVARKRYDGAEKIAALEIGADEYIQYPGKREEGMASVRALIRRYTEWNPCHGYTGCRPSEEGLCIMLERRRVFVSGREIIFPRKEFDLLHILASSPERVFTYEQLFYRVWREEGEFAESCMHSCINRIRRKLESVPDFGAKIENVRGVGYCYKERAGLLSEKGDSIYSLI